ncbi:hypothetical protein LTR85_002296 [Meristemomyces frigidus]|nr:hypothetical protein LTR85_002296 [Meristemomyces frigidus]
MFGPWDCWQPPRPYCASKVYSVDYVPERLPPAESMGAIPINFREADPVDQFLTLGPDGRTRSLDCVGYEHAYRNLTVQSSVIATDMRAVTSTSGRLGAVGVLSLHTMPAAFWSGALHPSQSTE